MIQNKKNTIALSIAATLLCASVAFNANAGVQEDYDQAEKDYQEARKAYYSHAANSPESKKALRATVRAAVRAADARRAIESEKRSFWYSVKQMFGMS